MKHLTPAQYIVHQFGGVRATGRAVGRHYTRVAAWAKPRSQGGLDGRIPSVLQPVILKLAASQGLDITPNDLVLGRTVPEEPQDLL